jgi:hypothetical protein
LELRIFRKPDFAFRSDALEHRPTPSNIAGHSLPGQQRGAPTRIPATGLEITTMIGEDLRS